MKKSKFIIALLGILGLTLSISSCGNNDNSSTNEYNNKQVKYNDNFMIDLDSDTKEDIREAFDKNMIMDYINFFG